MSRCSVEVRSGFPASGLLGSARGARESESHGDTETCSETIFVGASEALGGSTNAVLHILAIAHEAAIRAFGASGFRGFRVSA